MSANLQIAGVKNIKINSPYYQISNEVIFSASIPKDHGLSLHYFVCNFEGKRFYGKGMDCNGEVL